MVRWRRAVRWRCLRAALAAVLGAAAFVGCGAQQSVCADCLDTDGYHVVFEDPSISAQHPAALMFTGWRNGRCQSHVLCTGTPDVFLGDVRWGPVEWSRDCPDEELLSFASDYGLRNPEPSELPATQAAGGYHVAFPAATAVGVTLWLVQPATAEDQENAASDRETAARLYADLGTGFALAVDIRRTGPTPPVPLEDASCDVANALASAGANYDPNRLNVYLVNSLQGNRAGLNCYAPPGILHGEIMFVKRGTSYSPMQLAHELGHALGLVRAVIPPGGTAAEPGDVDELLLDPYLATDNLMRSGGAYIGSVTIGQTYRMHYDRLSWLNRSASAVYPAVRYPRDCQDSPVADGVCPALTLHPPRGWP